MSMSRIRYLNRSMLPGRNRSGPSQNSYKPDPAKSDLANALDVLRELTTTTPADEVWRLSLLSAFVKLLGADNNAGDDDIGEQPLRRRPRRRRRCIADIVPGYEFWYCLSASLVQPVTQIRAATLRAMRHLVRGAADVRAFNELQLPHLLCKSLDVLLDNEEERVQAMKLIRKMLAVAPRAISPIVVRSLVALGDSVTDDGDRMLRACLAILCEFGVLHPRALILCGGVSAITRNVLECHSPRIAESLVGVLLHLLDLPETRRMAGVRLDCLAAPYCDFTYRLGIMDKNKDARDLRFTSSRLALLTVLRSWAGTIEFCDPNRASGLKAIVDVLYLNQLEVRKAILDLLYELLWLPQPVWTDEYSVAFAVIDPADYQDAWRLAEGFVAAEGRAVLPTLATRVPNICESHTALLLYCFLETGLLNALVEVVVSGDTFISVRATVLIGKLLQLMHQHLPADILSAGSALPTLVAHAARGNHQACSAVAALQSLHQMLRNRPAACSLFLDAIIQSGSIVNSKAFRRDLDPSASSSSVAATAADALGTHSEATDWTVVSGADTNTPDKLSGRGATTVDSSTMKRRTRLDSVGSSVSTDEPQHHHRTAVHAMTSTLRRVGTKRMRSLFAHIKQNERWLRESNVLLSDDEKQWDWEMILTFLRTEAVNKMDDTHCRFIRRLVNFFKPSSNRFSHQDLGHGRYTPTCVTAGMELIDWLLQSQALECIRLLTDLCTDISTHLMAISTARSAHDCLFSPQHMGSTMCQQYFLFVGRMCRTPKGVGILNNTDIFERLSGIVQTTIHVCYIKLIVSGLDYTLAERPRAILAQAMFAADRRAGQLYATQFMMVLLRARLPQFEVWGFPLLVRQMADANRVVAMAAHEVLDEATHCAGHLEALIELWPDWERVGDAGVLTRTRFYSVQRGLQHARAAVAEEIERWVRGYNKSYVLLCEADTHSVLTLHTKNEEGAYSRRSCSSRPTIVAPNLLPHLYGQLAQTAVGLDWLQRCADLPQLLDCLRRHTQQMTTSADDNNVNNNNDATAAADSDAFADGDQQCIELKAAIWALCHTSTSRAGLHHLSAMDGGFVAHIIELCKHYGVYSVRASAFHALGLLGSTAFGADLLYTLDWMCVRHDRDTHWPICQPEDWMAKQLLAGGASGVGAQLRHGLDNVAPYNYAGMDDTMSVLRFSTEPTTDKLANNNRQSETTTPTADNDLVDAPLSMGTRSKTLPDGANRPAQSAVHVYKHTRSLSESKAMTIVERQQPLPEPVNGQLATQRTRFNSGTDSNTSGVSSCESVYGAAAARLTAMSELYAQHTKVLSPIPSSSNLLDVNSVNQTAAGATGSSVGRIRRISLTGASFRENTLSPQDAQGYAALRRLRSEQRPVFSESVADDLAAFIELNGGGCASVSATAAVMMSSTSARALKVRSLDRQSGAMIVGLENARTRTQSCNSTTTTVNVAYTSVPSNGPCYSGICLPKNILDLFQTIGPSVAGQSYVTQTSIAADDDSLDGQKSQSPAPSTPAAGALPARSAASNNNNLPLPPPHRQHTSMLGAHHPSHVQLSQSFGVVDAFAEDDPAVTSSLSSLSDVSSATTSRRSTWMSRHNRSLCFHCCRLSDSVTATSTNVAPKRRLGAPLSPPIVVSTAAGSNRTVVVSSATSSEATSGSELSDAADRISEAILRHVQRMANPVWSKQSKMALLELKQKHGTAYQDVCLYAEVCRALSANTYRLPARRFLQELFLDLRFESFTRRAAESFARCESVVLRELLLEREEVDEDEGDEEDGNDAVSAERKQTLSDAVQHQQQQQHVYATVKTLRHSQLPSVTEASVENLAESLGKHKPRLVSIGNSHLIDNPMAPRPQYRHSHTPTTATTDTDTVDGLPSSNQRQSSATQHSTTSSSSIINQNHRDHQYPMRPRFNTLELDLSCTKNKFPITDRRKQIEQQIQQQTSAPATPSEWSFQFSRRNSAGNQSSSATLASQSRDVLRTGDKVAAAATSVSASSSSATSNGSVLVAALHAAAADVQMQRLAPRTTTPSAIT